MTAILLRLSTLAAVLALAWSCSSTPESQDGDFESAAKDYLDELLASSPELATYLGDHRFDSKLGDYSREGFAQSLALETRYLERLDKIDPARLSPENAVDYEILRNQVESSIFELEDIREYEWNPLVYNVSGSIYALLARDFEPLDERLKDVAARLEQLPRVLDSARANLAHPPKVHTETAIGQNAGSISLIRDDLETFLADAPAMRAPLEKPRADAIQALEAYGEWLQQDLLPRADGDFRLGEAKFRKKLAFSLHTDMTMEQILDRAEKGLAETHLALYETALPLHREFFPKATDSEREDRSAVIRAVLTRLADDRPTNATIVDDAKATLEEATQFVAQANLVSLPAEPVDIIVMPEFQRGVSTAYCDSPGPLEKNGKTFYAISPTPESWTKQRADSFYREYNDYMLRDLTVHEAMPGHYLQLSHSNRYRGSTMTRAVFYSGTFVEGWAVYAEQIMVEHGFGGPRVKMQQLKMLTRAILNTILDQKIHAGSMTEDEAMRLMIDEGFQEDGEAAGKWRRACLTSAQLSTYFAGATEINGIRDAYEAKHGPIADWKAFHDQALSYGSPPAKYVKRMMGLE
ncbi:MAG: DUF885 domain-containing protein [Bryobacterales bacterium]|nr:DUF885 domain-containing protein [Bryobacterales bacterium]